MAGEVGPYVMVEFILIYGGVKRRCSDVSEMKSRGRGGRGRIPPRGWVQLRTRVREGLKQKHGLERGDGGGFTGGKAECRRGEANRGAYAHGNRTECTTKNGPPTNQVALY